MLVCSVNLHYIRLVIHFRVSRVSGAQPFLRYCTRVPASRLQRVLNLVLPRTFCHWWCHQRKYPAKIVGKVFKLSKIQYFYFY